MSEREREKGEPKNGRNVVDQLVSNQFSSHRRELCVIEASVNKIVNGAKQNSSFPEQTKDGIEIQPFRLYTNENAKFFFSFKLNFMNFICYFFSFAMHNNVNGMDVCCVVLGWVVVE